MFQTLIEILKSILYGIVEGITEWLPISSTGHLILLEEWLPFAFSDDPTFLAEFGEMFQVVIQLGAILAVVILFWSRLCPFGAKKTAETRRGIWQLWGKVVVASIPAAVIGIGFDELLEKLTSRDMDGWLYNAPTVAIMLIVYGVAFILIERHNQKREITPAVQTVEDITYSKALAIGAFQALSIVPGTSRSGSTILGSMLLGLSRTAGAEFSFFMAIPAMVGASLIKALGFVKYVVEGSVAVPVAAYLTLAVGCVVSLVVSLVAIRFLMDFVKRHTFSAFGVYRIILGVLVLLYFTLPLVF
ncbi:MAG: undecaprenyl-diphosphate phosphatase [Clostridia bacterium]|nr:undecaprenyl-diphosphate phosphatase [Clostridia bacterium]